MFLKKSSQKSKRRRLSYLFYCCNGSVVADSGNLETQEAGDGDVGKHRASCFSCSWLRRKKMPLQEINNQRDKEKNYQSRGLPPVPQKRENSTSIGQQVILETQPAAQLPQRQMLNLPTNPTSNLRRRSQLELDKQPTTYYLQDVNTRVEQRKVRKLDPKAGLLIIGATFAVMVFYGRVAAIVSLCACFYLAEIYRKLK